MLRKRTFLAALRQTPLKAGLFSAPTFTSARPRLLQTLQVQSRTLFSKRPSKATSFSSLPRWRQTVPGRLRNIRHNSNKPTPSAVQENGNAAQQSLSARFKELSRRYGYAAVGVYLGLSVIDFPFCFLAVRMVGPERVGEVEHAIVDAFWSLVSYVVPSMAPESRTENETLVEAEARETRAVDLNGHKHGENASTCCSLYSHGCIG